MLMGFQQRHRRPATETAARGFKGKGPDGFIGGVTKTRGLQSPASYEAVNGDGATREGRGPGR